MEWISQQAFGLQQTDADDDDDDDDDDIRQLLHNGRWERQRRNGIFFT